MTTAGSFIGIDVAKRQLDVAERARGARWTTANDGAGIAELVERLRAAGPVALIVLEATGGYEIPLVAALTAAQLPVVVVNPRQVRDFARAGGETRQDGRDRRGGLGALRGGAAARAPSRAG